MQRSPKYLPSYCCCLVVLLTRTIRTTCYFASSVQYSRRRRVTRPARGCIAFWKPYRNCVLEPSSSLWYSRLYNKPVNIASFILYLFMLIGGRAAKIYAGELVIRIFLGGAGGSWRMFSSSCAGWSFLSSRKRKVYGHVERLINGSGLWKFHL